MASFDKSIGMILKNEGGISNHKDDAGGLTNMGITQARYPDLDIINLTVDDAKAIYKRDFWNPNKLDTVSNQSTATHILDLVVNHGSKWGGVILQRALNDMGENVEIDGAIGKKTIAATNRLDQNRLNNEIVSRRIEFYNKIVKNKPSQAVFLPGWLYRANKFVMPEAGQTVNYLIAGILLFSLYKLLKNKGNP